MRTRALRVWALFALAALLACPATMAGAATSHNSKPAVRAAATRKAAPSKVKRRSPTRKARRAAPAGGIHARNAILVDPRTGDVLYAKRAERQVPIASLTKLMSAMVFLEQKPNLRRLVPVTAEARHGGGRTQLRIGERVQLGDLLHMSLMCSDNVATRVLVRESGLSHAAFIARMNRKARELGLGQTRFEEETGLSNRNVSTAAEVARLLHAAAHVPLVQDITTTREHAFTSETRDHVFRNTNRLLYGRRQVLGGKTGYISDAGWCFATWVRHDGRDLIAVVLGAPTEATRFADAVRLLDKAELATAQAEPPVKAPLAADSRAAAH